MSGSKSAKNKPSQDETATKKKGKEVPNEDSPNSAILMALQEQEERFAKKVKLAVREVMEEVLSGEIQTLKNMIESSNSAVNELRQDFTRQAELGKALQGRMDSMNANMRSAKQELNTHQQEIINLRDKIVEMEDRSRKCNVRLVGLPESAEGENAVQFLQENLPKWIPSLQVGGKIEIQRAHRIYGGRDKANRPRTLIFRLLRYQDRERILDGARAPQSEIIHGSSKLLFFPDFSNETALKRRSFDSVRRKLADRGLRPFLIYPVTLKVKFNGTLHHFKNAEDAGKFLLELDHAPLSTPATPSISASSLPSGCDDQENPSFGISESS
ncbi:LINE-1 type transposase domain-containing 1 [Labeo rohita]|uniref:LINE-1 type transposase domain-containing 1 n=1 Tax=Labeo rohita TaxID=84645 RepID=A0A498NZ29_LABRO|nr:LINE-1 type transposase domain-containing 1 [Labeo rohita]RXN37205.1 LINE-1 type transposase domain-containing 1 [Labeo rohita]